MTTTAERLELALLVGHSATWDWDIVAGATSVSPSYCELFGFPPDTTVTYERWLGAIHPEDRERCRQYGEAFFAGRSTDWRLDFRIVTPHQGIRWHRAVGKLYRDASDKPVRFIGVSSDVTEEHEALDALRESEERFRTMANALPLLVWVHDTDGKQQFVNRTFLEYFGVTESDMQGGKWKELVHPADLPAYEDRFSACIRDRGAFHGEVRVRNAEGEWRTIESWGSPRFSTGGAYLGMVGASVDVTHRRRMERTLRDADRHKDEFLAMLSHEMRSPLAAISTSLELLRKRVSHDDAIGKLLSTADRQANVLRRLLDDLQDLARIANGQISVVRNRVSLRNVIESAVAASRPIIDARGHRLLVQQLPDRLAVTGDEIRLVQVVANLLNNAAKYTPDNGRIELAVTREDPFAVISVRDNGIGIQHEMLDEIFGLFVQQSTSAHTGFGFGLTLVRRLVELHGGTVRAQSDGPGRGSEFTVRLPLYTD